MNKHPFKKLLAGGISLVVALSCMGAVACGGETTAPGGEDETPSGHEHTYDTTKWANDSTGHWHAATCEHTTEKSDFAAHTYEDGVCTVCNYVNPDYKPEEGGGTSSSVALPAENKIYLVGDSTVCSFADNYYMPRYGYGTQIAQYFNVTESQVVNLAISGRSSLSFLSEANYTTLSNSIAEGDYLIIGFGHNDEKSDDAARFTDPTKSYTDDSTTDGPSFQYTLYQNYVKLAKDKGATPILCTPITRYSSTADYTGAKVHVTADGDYVAAIKTLGEATDTTVIDLTTITANIYKADNTAAQYFHAHTTYELDTDGVTKIASGRDDTHINKYGAQMVVYQLATALKATDSTLAQHVKDNIAAPTDYTIAIYTGYNKPDYTTPDLASLTPIATIDGTNSTDNSTYTTTWYKSAMGDIGGADKLPNFSATYANGVFTISNAGGTNGKFASGSDGFVAAFMRVSKDDDFTISATAKVVSIGTAGNNQTGFGIMLRDDMYIDVHNNSVKSNYVAAGILNSGNTIFSREGGTLTKGSVGITPVANGTYTMKIERVGQNVYVTVSDGTNNYTQTYKDFDFFAVDNDYMYICLFANRNLTIEYSNVTYTYTGVSQGA